MYSQFSTAALSRIADQLVADIALASFSDRIHMMELESKLNEVKELLIIRMSNENDIWLATTRLEA